MSGSTTERVLPFRRGSVYSDGSTLTMSATVAESILGRIYKTTDSDGKDLYLRAVRADAALTNIGGHCVEYTAGYTGTNVAGIADTAGAIGSAVDDAYASTFDVAQYDIFYVVEEGYCELFAESDVAAGDPVMLYSNGHVASTTAGSYSLGTAQEAYASTSATVKVYIGSALKPSDAAS